MTELDDQTRAALRELRRMTPVGRLHDELARDPAWQAMMAELIRAAQERAKRFDAST